MPPITVISILPSFAPKQLLFLTIGFTLIGGSTVTVTVKLGPAQLPEVGDTVCDILQCHLLELANSRLRI
jgi:hypothetical protein